MKKFGLLALMLTASFNVNSALLEGKTVNYQYFFPDITSAYSNASNGDFTVDSSVEITNIVDSRGSMDISDSNIYVAFSSDSFFTPATFNGFKISDVFNSIADFSSVSINAATNMVGLDLNRITVLANEIWVNWQGLNFTNETIVSLDINSSANPSAVPVPAAAFFFAPALLGFVGLRRKAKNAIA